jgi:predicted GIY-YIG superfamily endonuclease
LWLTSRAYPEVMTCTYRLYDAAGQLLYVGVAYDFDERFRQHAAEKDWWTQVARRDVIWFCSRFGALYEEARAIEDERPLHNTRRGLHAIGLMVIRRVGNCHDRFRALFDGELVVNELDKTRILGDVRGATVHALLAYETRLAGVLVPPEWYARAREALGEGPADDCLHTVDAQVLV